MPEVRRGGRKAADTLLTLPDNRQTFAQLCTSVAQYCRASRRKEAASACEKNRGRTDNQEIACCRGLLPRIARLQGRGKNTRARALCGHLPMRSMRASSPSASCAPSSSSLASLDRFPCPLFRWLAPAQDSPSGIPASGGASAAAFSCCSPLSSSRRRDAAHPRSGGVPRAFPSAATAMLSQHRRRQTRRAATTRGKEAERQRGRDPRRSWPSPLQAFGSRLQSPWPPAPRPAVQAVKTCWEGVREGARGI